MQIREILEKILNQKKRKFIEAIDVTFMFIGTSIKGCVKLPNQKQFKGKILAFTKQTHSDAFCTSEVPNDKKYKKLMMKKYTHFGITNECINIAAKIVTVLGPRGKMPSEKSGNIGENINQVINGIKENTIYASKASKKAQLMHCSIGDCSMNVDQLLQNLSALQENLASMAKVKFNSVYISSTMGPSHLIKNFI